MQSLANASIRKFVWREPNNCVPALKRVQGKIKIYVVHAKAGFMSKRLHKKCNFAIPFSTTKVHLASREWLLDQWRGNTLKALFMKPVVLKGFVRAGWYSVMLFISLEVKHCNSIETIARGKCWKIATCVWIGYHVIVYLSQAFIFGRGILLHLVINY